MSSVFKWKVLDNSTTRWERPGSAKSYHTKVMVHGPRRLLYRVFCVDRLSLGYASWARMLSVIRFPSFVKNNQLFLFSQFFIFVDDIVDTFKSPIWASQRKGDFGTLICYYEGIMKENIIINALCWTMSFFVAESFSPFLLAESVTSKKLEKSLENSLLLHHIIVYVSGFVIFCGRVHQIQRKHELLI